MPTVAIRTPASRGARLAALALALSAAGCAAHARQVVRRQHGPEALEARGIRIVGASALPRELVAPLLRCEREGTPEATCRFEGLEVAYDLRGRLMARFELRRVADRDGHAMHEVVIDEGPYFQAEVRLDGLAELPEARAWGDALPLRTGGPFSVRRYGQTSDELLAAARGAGFGEAEVFPRFDRKIAAAVPGTFAVVARWDVYLGRRGERWKIGAIGVTDPDDGRRQRIERALAHVLRPGEPFDYDRFAAARAALLREYPTAEVGIGPMDGASHEVPILVRVRRLAL